MSADISKYRPGDKLRITVESEVVDVNLPAGTVRTRLPGSPATHPHTVFYKDELDEAVVYHTPKPPAVGDVVKARRGVIPATVLGVDHRTREAWVRFNDGSGRALIDFDTLERVV